MYDSRSDHPRGTGTRLGKGKHGSSHPERSWRRYYYDRAVAERPGLSTSEAVGDQHEESPIDLPGLKRQAQIEWRRRRAEWLGWDPYAEDDEPEDERLAGWEATLLDLPEGTVWTSTAGPSAYGYESEEEYVEEYLDDAWDDKYGRDPFLPCLSVRDVYAEFGEDGWHVEGPSTVRPEPLREGHYVRVWELAREIGVESKHLVTHLRLTGEYVAGHTSFIAIPVASRVRAEREQIVAQYGERIAKVPSPDPMTLLRERLLGTDDRAKVTRPAPRPGAPRLAYSAPLPGRTFRPAPRPGNNPFLNRSL